MQNTTKKSVRLQEEERRLVRRREFLLRAYINATTRRERAKMSHLAKRLTDVNDSLDALGQIELELTAELGLQPYIVSSLFLHECFAALTADNREQLFFITGPEVNGAYILDQRAEFAHIRRSAFGVEGEPKATHGVLIRLERFGHRLLAHFHSHPGRGCGGTLPSSIDTSFQARLERGGFPNVGAIFARDGIVRFFRIDGNLEVTVHGKGVEQIEPNIFRLTNINSSAR